MMKAHCYQHDGYDSGCSSCREMNGVKAMTKPEPPCYCGHAHTIHTFINQASDVACGECPNLGRQCNVYRPATIAGLMQLLEEAEHKLAPAQPSQPDVARAEHAMTSSGKRAIKAGAQPSQPKVDEQAKLRKENEQLLGWKRQQLEVSKEWDSVIAYLQAHFDVREWGGTWQEAILGRLAENSRLQAQLAQTCDALEHIKCRMNGTDRDSFDTRHIAIDALDAVSDPSIDWLATKLREAKAEALREAAEVVHHLADKPAIIDAIANGRIFGCHTAADWLRARAEELSKSNQGGSDETHS